MLRPIGGADGKTYRFTENRKKLLIVNFDREYFFSMNGIDEFFLCIIYDGVLSNFQLGANCCNLGL